MATRSLPKHIKKGTLAVRIACEMNGGTQGLTRDRNNNLQCNANDIIEGVCFEQVEKCGYKCLGARGWVQ